jgi:hypothetical protein
MMLLVFATVAMMLFMVTIALDLGGTIAALVFLLVIFVGATLRAWAPLVEWVRGPSANV